MCRALTGAQLTPSALDNTERRVGAEFMRTFSMALHSLVLLLVTLSVACSSRSDTDVARGDRAAAISAWARRIDADSAAQRLVEFDLPSSSTEGGLLRLFFADSSLRKLDAIYYGEMGRGTERYFLDADSLRLVVRAEHRYDVRLSGRVARTTVDSVWLAGDSIIQWVDTLGIRADRNPTVRRRRGAEILEEYRATRQLLSQGYRR